MWTFFLCNLQYKSPCNNPSNSIAFSICSNYASPLHYLPFPFLLIILQLPTSIADFCGKLVPWHVNDKQRRIHKRVSMFTGCIIIMHTEKHILAHSTHMKPKKLIPSLGWTLTPKRPSCIFGEGETRSSVSATVSTSSNVICCALQAPCFRENKKTKRSTQNTWKSTRHVFWSRKDTTTIFCWCRTGWSWL